MSLQDYYNDFRSVAASGELCRGEDCRGWLLSDVDTYHRCGGCDKATDDNHPENEDHEGECEGIGHGPNDDEGEGEFMGEVRAPAAPVPRFAVTFRDGDGNEVDGEGNQIIPF